MNQPAPASKSVLPIVLAIVGGVLFLGVAVIGVMAALGISGFRTYLSRAKQAEGMANVATMAAGMVGCAERSPTHELPTSDGPVPSSLAMVSGKKYMSAAGDWSTPGFSCAGFSLSSPQYFQYEWVQRSATEGTAAARADLDGDGSAEVVVEAEVTCSAGRCTAAPARIR